MGKELLLGRNGNLGTISLNFRSTFLSIKYTSLGANLPHKSFSEMAPWVLKKRKTLVTEYPVESYRADCSEIWNVHFLFSFYKCFILISLQSLTLENKYYSILFKHIVLFSFSHSLFLSLSLSLCLSLSLSLSIHLPISLFYNIMKIEMITDMLILFWYHVANVHEQVNIAPALIV